MPDAAVRPYGGAIFQTAPWLACLALVLASTPADARTVRIAAKSVVAPHVAIDDLHFDAELGADGGSLRLAAARLRVPEAALDGRVDWQCALRRAGDAQICEGPLRVGDKDEAMLAARVSHDRIEFTLRKDAIVAGIEWPFGDGVATAQARKLPAAWIAPLLAANWDGGALRAGEIDADVRLADGQRLTASYDARGLSIVSRDGTFSIDGVDAAGSADIALGDALRIDAQAHLAHGRLDAGVLHARLPDTPVEIAFDGTRGGDGNWHVARIGWHDRDALEFEASADFDPSGIAPLRALSVTSARLVFPLATTRYAQGVFAAHGFGGMELAGEVQGGVEVDERGIARLTATTTKFDLRDRARGIAMRGLRGGIDWRRQGAGDAQPLAWTQARFGAVAVDALRSRWQARDGAMRLVGPLDARVFGGSVKASDIVARAPGTTGEWLRGTLAVSGIGYDAPDGSLGAADVAAQTTLHVSGALDAPRVVADASLRGGQYLAGGLYVELPSTPVTAHVDGTFAVDRWRVDALQWNDPGVLEASATGQWQPAAQSTPALRVDLRKVDLARAMPRYAKGWLDAHGYRHLAAAGTLRGYFEREAGQVRAFAFEARGVDVVDGDGRFELHGLDGTLDWDARQPRPATTLGWQRVELYKVPFGPAQAAFGADTNALRLTQPLAIDVLGGQLRLEKFVAQPASPRGDRYEASFAVVGVQLPQMSAAFGWPIFPGNLSGGIPEIEFVGDRIDFHGGLDLYLFDGHLGVNGMSLERPFGAAPALGANIHFENFDLEQVTSAFSFGGMSGRLFGTIDGLRLLDWSPVAFDAYLRTNGGGRMSYKAVDDITGIGSGAPPMQTLALKLVNTFGFGKLGIRCRLRDEVCTMGGIDPLPKDIPADDSLAARGYAIVAGAGVPRIDIVGHRRRVDWPTLVRRLREATQGQAPVIE